MSQAEMNISDIEKPKPHQLIKDRPMSPEEYNGHRSGIWEAIRMELRQ